MSVHQSDQDLQNLPHNQQASAYIRSWRHNLEGYSRLSVECTPPSLVSTSSSQSPLSAKLCSMRVHRSVQDLEINSIISRPVPYQKLEAYLGGLQSVVSQMHTARLGIYQLLSITSICLISMSHVCASIRSKFRNLPQNQQDSAHIIHKRHRWEGCSRLSVECTPPSLVYLNSSPSSLPSKVCSM